MKDETKTDFINFTLQMVANRLKLPVTDILKKYKQKCNLSRRQTFPTVLEFEDVLRSEVVPMVQLAVRNAAVLNASLKAFVDKQWAPANFLESKVELIDGFISEIMMAVRDGKFELAESKIKLIEPVLPEIKSNPRYKSIAETVTFLWDQIEKEKAKHVSEQST